MNIIIKTKGNVKLTDSVRQHFEEQLSGVEKFFSSRDSVNVNVMIIEKNTKFKCEITIVLKHFVLRAECNGDTLYAAYDQAADKIEQQLIKQKRRANDFIKKRDGVADFFVAPVEEEKEQTVIKTKKIPLMEMSVDEAITQMELVDHEFFMFKSEDTHTACVVYKRKDGKYGLIEEI